MDNVKIILVALYRYRNFSIRTMHQILEDIPGVLPYTIFLKNCETNYFTYPTEKEEILFLGLIKTIRPKVVGLSVYSQHMSIACRLTKLIKDVDSSILVMWGGIHPTISPEDCIKEADIICLGEGEGAISDFVKSLRDGTSYQAVNNLWIKNGNNIIKNPMRPLIQDLDKLPFPAYGKDSYFFIDSSKVIKKDSTQLNFNNSISIQTSRGCPYLCSYCVNSLLQPQFKDLGPYIRRRSVDNVIQEIKQSPEAQYVYFIDEVFATDKLWLDEFEKKYKSEVGLPFYVEYNPKVINSSTLNKIVNAGLDLMKVGIQTGSDYIRNHIFNRPGKNSEIIQLAKELAGYKIKVRYDLIIDNPYDTEQTLKETIDLLLQLPKPLYLNLYSLQYFPRYPLTNRAVEDRVISSEEADVNNLPEKTGKKWAFVPRLSPYSNKQKLQNILWLMEWNHVKDKTVRFAVFENRFASGPCLNYLNFKSIILGKILGVGGIVWKNYWLVYLKNGIGYILKGDFKTFYFKITKRLKYIQFIR